MTLTSPVNGLPYHYAVGPTGWTYTAPNGEQFEEANLWEELALPDFNLTYGGQPVAVAELSWNLSYGVTDDPLRPPGTNPGVPSKSQPAPTPNIFQRPEPSYPSYSHSYGAFLACEYNHTLGDNDMAGAWAAINGLAITAILTGAPRAAVALTPAALTFDFGGMEAIRSACSEGTYGPAR